MKLLLITLLLLSCGSRHRATILSSKLDYIAAKSERYLSEMERDRHGFIMTEKCDATLFSGLLGAATGDVDLLAASNSDMTQWWRRPDKDCSPTLGNSRSTISRDMILGVMWWMWRTKNLEAAEALMDDLKRRVYVLRGEGTPGELWMNPTFMSTLAHIILRLGGPRHEVELAFPRTYSSAGGFIAHLNTWHILLHGDIQGHISGSELDLLRRHAMRQPTNPLFQAAFHKYTDGDQSVAIKLLQNNHEWPSSRLPSTDEHCSEWPIERDVTYKDWGPCTPHKEHTGAEMVVMYHLILRP